MPDPDRDAESESRTDPRFDNWPIDRYDAYASWPVERATPGDHDAAEDVAAEYAKEEDVEGLEWIGFTSGGAPAGGPYLYQSKESAIYRGDIDDENKRVILRERDRRDVESEDSLAEHIEEIGEEHGWSWLSSFAREFVEDDTHPEQSTGEFEHRDTEFSQRNVSESAEYDLSFTGSHTFADESNRVHIIDRTFDVYLDENGAGSERVTVEVGDHYLLAEAPLEESRAGDADLINERQYELYYDIDTDEVGWERTLETALEEWHSSHVSQTSSAE